MQWVTNAPWILDALERHSPSKSTLHAVTPATWVPPAQPVKILHEAPPDVIMKSIMQAFRSWDAHHPIVREPEPRPDEKKLTGWVEDPVCN